MSSLIWVCSLCKSVKKLVFKEPFGFVTSMLILLSSCSTFRISPSDFGSPLQYYINAHLNSSIAVNADQFIFAT